jgi:hypothetical protein
MWLPGFEPDAAETPIPSPEPDHAAQPAAELAATLAAAAPEAPSTLPRASWRVAAVTVEVTPRALWPRLSESDLLNLTGAVTKFDANLAAVAALRRVEAEQRPPTPAERRTLLRYTGWGGLPASFNPEASDKSWAARAELLREMLDDADHESARASVNNSHYTEVHVIEAMWQAVQRFGFTGGRVLEPAAGVGHFIGAMPEALAASSSVTAVEIDRLSGRLLHTLYAPFGVDVRVAPFEKTPLPDQWFDLVIGNVPFGKYKVADASNRPYARFSIHNYFFGRALDLTRPGGLVCLITSSHTMDAHYDQVLEYLSSQAQLLGAIRLPKGAFAGIASTEVQTDILFLRKRQRAEAAEADWLELGVVPDILRHPQCHERYLQINAWYARHP